MLMGIEARDWQLAISGFSHRYSAQVFSRMTDSIESALESIGDVSSVLLTHRYERLYFVIRGMIYGANGSYRELMESQIALILKSCQALSNKMPALFDPSNDAVQVFLIGIVAFSVLKQPLVAPLESRV